MHRFEIEQFVEIATWSEVITRPGFVAEIDPAHEKPVEVIAAYSFPKDSVTCGLKNCHQPHIKGFLVRTSEDREANIGQDCGRQIFGAEFRTLANRFHEAERQRDRRKKLNEVWAAKDEHLARLKDLCARDYGAEWLRKSLANFRQHYPSSIVSNLTQRAQRNDNQITEERQLSATEREIENQSEATKGLTRTASKYERVVVARIDGLSVLNADIRKLVVEKAEGLFRALEKLDPATASSRQVKELYDRAVELPDVFSTLESLLEEGKAFFGDDNLAKLKLLATDETSKSALQDLKWHYRCGEVTVKPKKEKTRFFWDRK